MFRAKSASGDETEIGVSIIAPYRNEAKNLPAFISRIPAWVDEVIFVDGQSTDGSADVITALMPSARQLNQPGRGKGAALAFGMVNATQEIVIAIDTDGSMDPDDCCHLVYPLATGADLVKGSRYLPSGGSDDLTALRNAGNRVLTASANTLFQQNWSELCYGFFGLWTKHLETLQVREMVSAHHLVTRIPPYGSGFEIETLMFCRAARMNLNIKEIPSFEKPRVHGSSNLRTFRDGARVVWSLAVERTRAVREPALQH